MNTHRQFSRNSASSRAIPTAKMIQRVRENPFVPEMFTENKKGMQGGEVLSGEAEEYARSTWVQASKVACVQAEALLRANVHKQYVNRLLEPFLWHTAIITATEWSNFFTQRLELNADGTPMAQPEMYQTARLMKEAIEQSEPVCRSYGEWHLPYTLPDEQAEISPDVLKKVSVARCARVSYETQDGKRDIDADLALYERLRKGSHWSPFEHVAYAMASTCAEVECGNFVGWMQYRKCFVEECR